MPIVRINGFKLEGGGAEFLKENFRKLKKKKNEIISRNNGFRNSVRQNSKQKLQYQKNNWLFRRNNRLFWYLTVQPF